MLLRVNERVGAHPFLQETNVSGIYPPLGLAYLAGAARRAGFGATILEAHAHNLSPAAVLREIVHTRPDLVGLSANTFSWPLVARLARNIRAELPRVPIVIGGPQLSLYPRECMEEQSIDVAVLGEGDETVVELLERLARGDELAGTPGTLVRVGDDIVQGPDRPPVNDLDSLALPAIDLFPLDEYRSMTIATPFVTIVTSRGCPYRCRYCSQVYVGGHYREHGAERVTEEMIRAVERFGAREIIFFDETFTINRARVLDVCSAIAARDLGVHWHIRTRGDLLDEEMLLALREAGCASIHIGIEAGTARIRSLMNKQFDMDKTAATLERARKLRIETRGYFMIGYPGETPEEIEETIRLSLDLPLDWASYTITQPAPGTDIYRDAVASGHISGDYWRDYTLLRISEPLPYFTSERLSTERLESLLRQAYRRFYLRPRVVAGKLTSRRLIREFPSLSRTLGHTIAANFLPRWR